MGVNPGHESLKTPYFSVSDKNLDEVQKISDKRFEG